MIDLIGKAAMLEMLAEESAELTHAALKLARVYRGENPTPRSEMECIDKLTEEAADVQCVLEQLTSIISDERVNAIKAQKLVRWKIRMGGD